MMKRRKKKTSKSKDINLAFKLDDSTDQIFSNKLNKHTMGCKLCKCEEMAKEYIKREIKAIQDATNYSISCEKGYRDIALISLYEFETFSLIAEREQLKCCCHLCVGSSEFHFSHRSRAHVIVYETDLIIEKQLFQNWNEYKRHIEMRQNIQNEQIEGH
jgi:hypothetical protein